MGRRNNKPVTSNHFVEESERQTRCGTLSEYLHPRCYTLQVNKYFYKLERVYRDCIKMTRDKMRIYSILHDAPGT